jgi:hypothetical protein
LTPEAVREQTEEVGRYFGAFLHSVATEAPDMWQPSMITCQIADPEADVEVAWQFDVEEFHETVETPDDGFDLGVVYLRS